MNSESYNSDCNDEMRWDEDGDGAGGEDDVDDDIDDARDDGDDDGDDLPFREVFSPAESARRRTLFFSIGLRHGAAAELRKLLPEAETVLIIITIITSIIEFIINIILITSTISIFIPSHLTIPIRVVTCTIHPLYFTGVDYSFVVNAIKFCWRISVMIRFVTLPKSDRVQ